MPQATVQQKLSKFQTTPTPTVQTTHDGVVIPPDEVGDYTRVRMSHNSTYLYAAPLTVTGDENGHLDAEVAIQQFHFVEITKDSRASEQPYKVCLQTGIDRDIQVRDVDGVITEADTKKAALEAAIDWMHTTSPTVAALPFTGTADRPVVTPKIAENHADRIREGSTIYVDDLPPATVTEASISYSGTNRDPEGECICELPDGTEFTLTIGEPLSRGYHSSPFHCYYNPPSGAPDHFDAIRAAHIAVDNEDNLRESVDTDTYEWLQSKQGETVIYQDESAGTFQAIQIEKLRDGFVNPGSDGGLSPDSHSLNSIYVDGDGEWVMPDAEEITTTVDHTIAADVDSVSYADSVSEISGVGSATADKMWCDTIGELYDSGWPTRAYISGRFTEKVISTLYNSRSAAPRLREAVCAIIGQLGGIGVNADGEKVATLASQLTGSTNPDEIAVALIGGNRQGVGPSAGWVDDISRGTTVSVGDSAMLQPKEAIADARDIAAEEVSAQSVSRFISPEKIDTDHVAIDLDDGNPKIRHDMLTTAATVADVDLSNLSNERYEIMAYQGRHGLLLTLTNTEHNFTVTINGDRAVEESDLHNLSD